LLEDNPIPNQNRKINEEEINLPPDEVFKSGGWQPI